MMMVVIAVLSIVLSLTEPLHSFVEQPWAVLLCAALAVVLPAIPALLTSRRVRNQLDAEPETPNAAQITMARGVALTQWLLGASHAALLLMTDWQGLCRPQPGFGQWPVIPSLVVITPFLASILLVWLALYPADRAIRQVALEVYLFRGKPVRPVWRIVDYVVYNFRHQVLIILIPVLLILIARDLAFVYRVQLRALVPGVDRLGDIVVGGAAVLVAIITPAILRYVWVTQRLADGPLRDKLLALCARLKVRCRELLVWRAGGATVNAAVTGVVAPLRYVLITDAMLEQMEDLRIEAVFGHELGHVKRHHIFFLLTFAVITGCGVTIFSVHTEHLAMASTQFQILACVMGALLMLKWGVGFGWLSRRFERQADIYAARTLALAGLPCHDHCHVHGDPPTLIEGDARTPRPTPAPDALLAPSTPICLSAARVFAATLEQVAYLNGIAPEAGSWRHGSIAARIRTILRYARHPEELRRFETSLRRVKWSVFITAAVASLWALTEVGAWNAVTALVGR